MKKSILKTTSIFALVSLLFFACKKDKAPVKVPTCAETLLPKATAFEAKATAFENKINSNPLSYTTTECNALRVEAIRLIAEVKACPELASDAELIEELDDLVLNELICP